MFLLSYTVFDTTDFYGSYSVIWENMEITFKEDNKQQPNFVLTEQKYAIWSSCFLLIYMAKKQDTFLIACNVLYINEIFITV